MENPYVIPELILYRTQKLFLLWVTYRSNPIFSNLLHSSFKKGVTKYRSWKRALVLKVRFVLRIVAANGRREIFYRGDGTIKLDVRRVLPGFQQFLPREITFVWKWASCWYRASIIIATCAHSNGIPGCRSLAKAACYDARRRSSLSEPIFRTRRPPHFGGGTRAANARPVFTAGIAHVGVTIVCFR